MDDGVNGRGEDERGLVDGRRGRRLRVEGVAADVRVAAGLQTGGPDQKPGGPRSDKDQKGYGTRASKALASAESGASASARSACSRAPLRLPERR